MTGVAFPIGEIAFAEAYLESATVLCERLVRSNAEATYVRGAVPLFLTHQATELFLKAAILATDPESSLRNNHDIKQLFNRYKNLYPGARFAFQAPFVADDPNEEEMGTEAFRECFTWKEDFETKYPENQRYRYPLNRDHQPFGGAYGFEANLFLADLRVLKARFDAISQALPKN